MIVPQFDPLTSELLLLDQPPQRTSGGGGGGGAGTGSSTNGFEYTGDYEKTGTYVYAGYQHADGRWFIYRRTVATNARQYAEGSSGYATNWTGRAGLTYA